MRAGNLVIHPVGSATKYSGLEKNRDHIVGSLDLTHSLSC